MKEPPDLETLARRYVDLWQDQVTALAADPEFTQTFGRLLQVSAAMGPAGWLSLWTAAAEGLKGTGKHEPGAAQPTPRSGPSQAAAAHGAAAAPAARDDGGADLAELRRRLAALEERIAGLGGGASADRAGRPAVAPVPAGAGKRSAARARGRRSR